MRSNTDFPPVIVFVLYAVLAIMGLAVMGVTVVIWLGKKLLSLAEQRLTIPAKARKIIRVITLVLLSYPFIAAFSLITWIYQDLTPQSGEFFVINAAIKNTCFIDPNRENCPQSVAEIGYIEPKHFADMMDCCQVNYQYDAEENLYTLVVRYAPTQAALFDWRLVGEIGYDFKEYEVEIFGQDRLKNPPEWDGPWTFPDWDYPYINPAFE